MKTWIFVLLLIPSITYAGTENPAKIKMKNISEQNRPIVKKAINSIINSCPRFKEYWSDVKSAHVETWKGIEGLDYRRDQFGWKNYIVFTIKIKDETKIIPEKYGVWGHTLTYYAGGGNRSGVLTQKLEAQHFCGGFQLSKLGVDAFMFNTSLMVLDRLH